MENERQPKTFLQREVEDLRAQVGAFADRNRVLLEVAMLGYFAVARSTAPDRDVDIAEYEKLLRLGGASNMMIAQWRKRAGLA
jgi:hypothetical protein